MTHNPSGFPGGGCRRYGWIFVLAACSFWAWTTSSAAVRAAEIAKEMGVRTPSFAGNPMLPGTLAGLRELFLLNPLGAQAGAQSFIPLLALDPSKPTDLALAGPLNAALPADFGLRLRTVLEARNPGKAAGAYNEVLAAYGKAAGTVEKQIALEFAGFEERSGRISSSEIRELAQGSWHWAFYGPKVAASIDRIRKLARDKERYELGLMEGEWIEHLLERNGRQMVAGDTINRAGNLKLLNEGVLSGRGVMLSRPVPKLAPPVNEKMDEMLRRLKLRREVWDGNEADGRRIGKFINEIRVEEMGISPGNYDIAAMRREFDRKRGELFFLRDEVHQEGAVMATAAYSPFMHQGRPLPGLSRLEMVYFHPHLRGVKHGGEGNSLGRMMVLIMMMEANRSGYDQLLLRTRVRSMAKAVAFYLKLGFLPGSIGIDEMPQEELQRTKFLEEIIYLARDIGVEILEQDFPVEFIHSDEGSSGAQ